DGYTTRGASTGDGARPFPFELHLHDAHHRRTRGGDRGASARNHRGTAGGRGGAAGRDRLRPLDPGRKIIMPGTETLSRRVLELSPAKRALMERFKRGEFSGVGGARTIPARPRHEPLPQSFAQQRLWFLDQLVPGSPAYNMATGVRLKGELDARALGAALEEVGRRHEALRTTFGTHGDLPVQLVPPSLEVGLPTIDVGARPEKEREAEPLRLAREEANRPFDLTAGPLLRATLVRLEEREHMLLLTTHHIISDGWSIGILVREIAELYEAFLAG